MMMMTTIALRSFEMREKRRKFIFAAQLYFSQIFKRYFISFVLQTNSLSLIAHENGVCVNMPENGIPWPGHYTTTTKNLMAFTLLGAWNDVNLTFLVRFLTVMWSAGILMDAQPLQSPSFFHKKYPLKIGQITAGSWYNSYQSVFLKS